MRTESLAAIDVHVHIEVDGHGHRSLDDELLAASAKYFRASHDRTPTLEQIADLYRSLNIAAVGLQGGCVHGDRACGDLKRGDRDAGGGALRRADPVRLRGPVARRGRGRAGTVAGARLRGEGIQVPPDAAGVRAERPC